VLINEHEKRKQQAYKIIYAKYPAWVKQTRRNPTRAENGPWDAGRRQTMTWPRVDGRERRGRRNSGAEIGWKSTWVEWKVS